MVPRRLRRQIIYSSKRDVERQFRCEKSKRRCQYFLSSRCIDRSLTWRWGVGLEVCWYFHFVSKCKVSTEGKCCNAFIWEVDSARAYSIVAAIETCYSAKALVEMAFKVRWISNGNHKQWTQKICNQHKTSAIHFRIAFLLRQWDCRDVTRTTYLNQRGVGIVYI